MGEIFILGWCKRQHQCRARGEMGPNALTGSLSKALSVGFEEEWVGVTSQVKGGLPVLNEMEAAANGRYPVGQDLVRGGVGLEAVWALAVPEVM